MKKITEEIRTQLQEKNLKITPQRISIMEAIFKLDNHPTADEICVYVRKNNPNVATGTVYKVLETLVERKLVKKVRTCNGIMRYDAKTMHHHHIYHTNSNIIDDYEDHELDDLLNEYFNRKKLENFTIKNIVLQIHGVPKN